MEVLIVEDSDDDYEATLRALDLDGHDGVTVSRCRNGAEAWDYLLSRNHDDLNVFDRRQRFVILDLNMPGLDGRGLLSLIKTHERLKSIPVAVLSTSDDLNDVNVCYQNGANTFIRKPVNWEQFVTKMNGLKDFWFRHAELPNLR